LKRSILYLDDEQDCLDVFRDMFSQEYDIRTVSTIEEALGELAVSAADIVISDQHITDEKGTDFLRTVAENYPSSYRVMLTGNAKVGDVVQDISGGTINLFIAKPWTEEEMGKALKRASDSYELHRKLMIRQTQQL
jgi:DNA-binding NtrC family response regulator